MGELSGPGAAHRARLAERWIEALAWAALAMCVRAWWLSVQPAAPAWDGAIYHRTAERIARGMGFVDTWNNRPPYRPTAFYPVGYPAVLGAGYALLGAHYWVAGLINVVAGGVSAVCAVRLARAAFGRAASHAAGALFALAPGPVIYTSAFMTEPVSAALLGLALLAALRHARAGRAWSALAMGALLGVGGLVRPPALLVAPVLALAATPIAAARRGGRDAVVAAVRALALCGVACALVVLPWTARNCARLDGCALVSVNGGSNLWIGADPAANGGYRDLRPREGCDHVHGEVAKDRCYGRLAVARIRAAPLAWLALAPAKLGQLLGYESSPVSYLRAATGGRAFAQSAPRVYNLMSAYHRGVLALAALALAPWGVRRRDDAAEDAGADDAATARRARALMVAAVLALVAVHVVFFGVDRYHFVFTPVLCALAGGVLRPWRRGA